MANANEGSIAHTKLFLRSHDDIMRRTPIKDLLSQAGADLTITVQTDGFALDRLSGRVIVNDVKVTASLGNLSQGSFSFLGNGPLT